MTLNARPDDHQLALAPLDEKADHVRGLPAGPLILEYGDYECPYSRQAFHAIEQIERQLGGNLRFAYRHFPLTRIHPHALAAAGFGSGVGVGRRRSGCRQTKPGRPSSASTPTASKSPGQPADRYSHPKPRLGHSRPDGPRSRRTITTRPQPPAL
jgi:hypothetical protein